MLTWRVFAETVTYTNIKTFVLFSTIFWEKYDILLLLSLHEETFLLNSTVVKCYSMYIHVHLAPIIAIQYLQGSGSWSSSWHLKVASGLSAKNVNLTLFLFFLYLTFPLILAGQGPVMAYYKKQLIEKLICIYTAD